MHTNATIKLAGGVNVPSLLNDPKTELLPIIRHLSEWREVDAKNVSVVRISGAMTNFIFKCHNEDIDKFVLVRIFGANNLLFDREEEQNIFAAVSHTGLGPKLLVSFANGRVEEFLLDRVITSTQMQSQPVAVCIAAAMAMFNFTKLSKLKRANTRPICWSRLRSWYSYVKQVYSEEELERENLLDIDQQINLLEQKLENCGPSWIGFCHNDTQYGNMLLHVEDSVFDCIDDDDDDMMDTEESFEQQPSGTLECDDNGVHVELGSSPPSYSYLQSKEIFIKSLRQEEEIAQKDNGNAADVSLVEACAESNMSVRLIDYEYAGYNPIAYDIANHWCEYSSDYHSATPHVLQFDKFPSKEQQRIFTRAYVKAVVALKKQKETLALPTRASSLSSRLAASASSQKMKKLDEDVEAEKVDHIADKIIEAAVSYVPVSHLTWGLWGLLQARQEDVPDFDFMAYARQRLSEFRKCVDGNGV